MNNLVYGKRETRGLFPVELQAGKHNYRVDPWSGRFPIHSSCKSCRLERVFKPSFSTVARSFRSFSEGREREREDGSVNGPSEAISCAPAPLLITSPRVSRGLAREIHVQLFANFRARRLIGTMGTTISPRKLATAMFSVTLFMGTKREREKKKRVASTRTIESFGSF